MTDDVAPAFQVLLAGSAALVQDLPIEQGRVRSRRLFRGDGGTVLGVAMDAGAIMREHIAPAPILIHVVQGHARLEVGGSRLELPTGALVHVDARVEHEVEAVGETRFLLVLLDNGRPGAS